MSTAQEFAKASFLERIKAHTPNAQIPKQLCVVLAGSTKQADLDVRWEVVTWGGPTAGRTSESLVDHKRALSGTFLTELEVKVVRLMLGSGELRQGPEQSLHDHRIAHLTLVPVSAMA